jgi:hypothetical protein
LAISHALDILHDRDQGEAGRRESRLPLGRKEMRKLVIVVQHAELIADLHHQITLREGPVSNLDGLFWDGIVTKACLMHRHGWSSLPADHPQPAAAMCAPS